MVTYLYYQEIMIGYKTGADEERSDNFSLGFLENISFHFSFNAREATIQGISLRKRNPTVLLRVGFLTALGLKDDI
ncbi:hypothetical protein SeMB42_g06439 [Synchytrium endobioticum]|uniref:Uncharacterized protein n=1 Tax=Synchytrium endobioticum TaxID=286115 RepID=A0A507CKZ3_9FUNG|nr:hypothetical protein SeMB42_g06439 [Synchytrium endobioticum]